MKPNLSHQIGIVIAHWPLEPIDWWLKAGCRHFRIGVEWDVFSTARGMYSFEAATAAFRKIKDAGGKVLVHLFGVPSYLDPTYPKIRNSNAIPIMRDEWVIDWVDYVRSFLEWAEKFGDAVEVCGPIIETNLPGWWEDEATKRERSAEDFIRLVIRPVAPLIRQAGKKIIAGTVTLQGERSWTFRRAIKQFEIYKTKNFGSIDHLDFHCYREIGSDTVRDIKRVFEYFEAKGKPIQNPVWISELGFNEKGGFTIWENISNFFKRRNPSGEERQERKYKQLFEFLASDKQEDIAITERIKRIYLYRGHAGEEDKSADELLNPPTEQSPEWTPKKAGALVREYLQGTE